MRRLECAGLNAMTYLNMDSFFAGYYAEGEGVMTLIK